MASYGINILYLTMRYWLTSRRIGTPLPALPVQWPRVTVQLPIYNELYMVDRLLRSVAGIDYPRDCLEVQVLDDSTDSTSEATRELVDNLMKTGLDIVYLHRDNRKGFKAGALANGLEHAKGNFIALFDADFIPPADFLKRTIPFFQHPQIGCVQTRWAFCNADDSAFTRTIATCLDGHFLIEKRAQSGSNYFLNFNGSGGVWRREAIESSGGWHSDTLSEDLDLSFRAQISGWRILYSPDIVCMSEIPSLVEGYRRQQFRWAKGAGETFRKVLKKLWGARLPFTVKLQATLLLTSVMIHPLMLVTAALTAFLSLDQSNLPRWLPYFGISALGLPALMISAMIEKKDIRLRHLIDILRFLLIGAGLVVTCSRAVIEAMLGLKSPFLRTPKFAGNHNINGDYTLRISWAVWAELPVLLVFLGTIAAVYSRGFWGALFIMVMPLLGYFYVTLISIRQGKRIEKKSNGLSNGADHRETPCSS